MKRKTLLATGAVILAACNSLVGNDSESAWSPDASAVDATGSDGSGSSSGVVGGDASGGGDSTLSDSGSSSGRDAGSDATYADDATTDANDAAADADDAAVACDAPGGAVSDPHNCGACGHDCLGGACNAGVCGPVTLVTGQARPINLAVNGGRVFWFNFQPGPNSLALMAVDVDGGALREVFSGYGNQVISSGSSIYAANYDGYSVGVVNPASLLIDGIGTGAPSGIAADDDAGVVYWIACDSANGDEVVSVLSGTNGSSPNVLATDEAPGYNCPTFGMALADPYIFYQTASTDLVRIPITGCPDAGSCGTHVYGNGTGSFPATVGSVVSDGTYVYWSDPVEGFIYSQDVALSGEPTVVQDGLPISQYILLAVDQTNVYWSDMLADGGVSYAAKDGGNAGQPERRLAAGQAWPWGITTDDSNVYWATQGSGPAWDDHQNGDGTVVRVAKP